MGLAGLKGEEILLRGASARSPLAFALKLRKAPHMLRFLSILTVAPIALAGCEKPDPEQVEFDKSAPTAVLRMMPADERTMIVIVQRGRRAFDAASLNELQAHLTRPARALELCELFKSTSVRNWTGVISQPNDGRGILTVKIADDIEIGTGHNAVSDTFHRTLIEPDSAVYRSDLELRKGTPVIFSGELFRKDSDCLYESSATLRASMTSPTFIFKFTNVEPISN
jgi:hypothetical protein